MGTTVLRSGYIYLVVNTRCGCVRKQDTRTNAACLHLSVESQLFLLKTSINANIFFVCVCVVM